MSRVVWCRKCGSVSISDSETRCYVCKLDAVPIGVAGIRGDSLVFVPMRDREFDTIYSSRGTFKRISGNIFKKVRE